MLSSLLSLTCLFGAASSVTFSVSPTGSDSSGNGSSSSPWATPGRAFDAIVSAKAANNGACPPEGFVISLGAGSYYLDSTLVITPENSCSPSEGGSVTVIGSADAASPSVLSAGQLLSGWQALPGYAGVYTVELPASANQQVRQLFSTSGALPRRLLSRSPVMTAVAVGQWGVGYQPGSIVPSDAAAIDNNTEVVIWHNWVTSQNKIGVFNATNSSIFPKGEAGDPFFNAGGLRWALQNVPNPSTLAAGAFYVSQGALVYRALPGEDPTAPSGVQFVAENLGVAVSIEGNSSAAVYNVLLTNLSIAHSAAQLEQTCLSSGCACQSNCEGVTGGYLASYAVACGLTNVEVFGTGSYAVYFDEGCADCYILGSHLYSLGSGGVRIGNSDNTGLPSLAPASNTTIADCTIEDAGHVIPAGTGIFAQEATGTTIEHNHIHHLYYSGVCTGWTWGYAADSDEGQYVGYNLIHDIFQGELSDGGCVYNLGRSPYTQIINNVCYNVNAYGYGGWGYYLDEGSSNVTMLNNIVWGTKDASFHQHYGTDNLITNNIFAYGSSLQCNDPNQYDCDRSALKSSQHISPCGNVGEGEGCNSSFTFKRNIVYLGAPNISSFPWVINNTRIVGTYGPHVGVWNMTWEENLYFQADLPSPATQLIFGPNGDEMDFQVWLTRGKDAGSIIADPLFSDPAHYNFTLLPASPAFSLGFQQIDVSTVGPRPTSQRGAH